MTATEIARHTYNVFSPVHCLSVAMRKRLVKQDGMVWYLIYSKTHNNYTDNM